MGMESFHVCFSAAQRWLGTVAEQGSAWSASDDIYLLFNCNDHPRNCWLCISK